MEKQICTPSSSSTLRSTDHRDNTSGSCKYKGVRKRKWGRWVSEIRLPNSRERIWLGSYDSPEKAARAFDAALFCLRGRDVKFNFPESPPEIEGGRKLSPSEIQVVAARFANEMEVANKNDNVDNTINYDQSHSANFNNAVGIEQCNTSTWSSVSVSDGALPMKQVDSEVMDWSPFLSISDTNTDIRNYEFYPELDDQLYHPPADADGDTVVNDDHGGQGFSLRSSFLWNF